MNRKTNKLVHEGKYAAEVPVELVEDDTAWSPYLTPDDARKLDTVRLALRRGDVAEAAKYGRVGSLIEILPQYLANCSELRRFGHLPILTRCCITGAMG